MNDIYKLEKEEMWFVLKCYNDYIIDFINYDDSLEFTDDIGVEVTDTGINLTYYVNEEIDDSDEILMFFIPIDNGVLGNFIMGDREFVVK